MEAVHKELTKYLKKCYDESCVSFKNKEKEGITKYYSEDVMILWPGFKLAQGMKVLDEYLTTLMSIPAPTNFKFVTDELVLMSENIAYERGTVTVTTDDGKIFNTGKTLVIWKKVGDKWLIDVDSFNYDNVPDYYLTKD